MASSQPPSPTSVLKSTFEELQLSRPKSRKYYQYEDDEDDEDFPVPEFRFFTLLPAELRLKIYTLALPGPRLTPIHYTSSTISTSLSRTPSPSPSPCHSSSSASSTYHPTHKRICRSSNPHEKSEKKEYPLIGCTSPARIPALLHTCRESRSLAKEHYTLSFRLAGPKELFVPKIWFSMSSSPSPSSVCTALTSSHQVEEIHPRSGSPWGMEKREGRDQDILYFPSLPGYCASFKHFTSIVSLLASDRWASVTRLAVHEDLFLEENKRRASLDSGVGMGWDEVERRGSFGSMGGGGGGGAGAGAYWNTDEIVEERLLDFWRSVARKFGGVREVWVMGDGREGDILSLDEGLGTDGNDRGGAWMGSASGRRSENVVWKDREGFSEMVGRVLDCVEVEMGGRWIAPRWFVLRGGV